MLLQINLISSCSKGTPGHCDPELHRQLRRGHAALELQRVQVYTRIFEIVERRNNDGFGAANAAIRLAAQAREVRPMNMPRA